MLEARVFYVVMQCLIIAPWVPLATDLRIFSIIN
jgi:hypothetical protein